MLFKNYKGKALDAFTKLRKWFLGILDLAGILAAFAGFLILLYHIGYPHSSDELLTIQYLYNVILWMLVFSSLAGITIKKWEDREFKFRIAELIIIPFLLLILEVRMDLTGIDWSQYRLHILLNHDLAVHIVIILGLIVEISTSSLQLNNRYTNPGLLFAFSFLFIIVLGTGLLLLPNSSYTGISFTNAFFYINECGMCYRPDNGGYSHLFYPAGPNIYHCSDTDRWPRNHDLHEFFWIFF